MRRLSLGFGVLVVLGMAPAIFADVTDYMFNINGTTYCPSFTAATCSNYGGFAAAPVVSTIDESYGGTGLGTVKLTYNPGPGTYNVNLWVFEQLSQPGYNEYGAVNGAAAAGQSWQIDVPDYLYNVSDPNFGSLPAGAGTIIANTAANTLANTNYVTGNTAQDLLACSADPTCNDYTSMAMGFNFTLGASQEEILSFRITNVAPAGFSLEQIHPVDGSNSTEIDYYFTGSATTQSTAGGSVPEPGSLILLATVAGILSWKFRSRFAAVKAR